MSINEAIETQLALLDFSKKFNKKESIRHFSMFAERSLEYGATYYWPEDFCKLLEGQANRLPDDATLNVTDFLSESGFVWFEKAVKLPVDPSIEVRFLEWKNKFDLDLSSLRNSVKDFSDDVDSFYKNGKLDLSKAIDLGIDRSVLDKKEILIADKLKELKEGLDYWNALTQDRPLKAISWSVTKDNHIGVIFWVNDFAVNDHFPYFPDEAWDFELPNNLTDTIEGTKEEPDHPRIAQALKYMYATILFMVQKVFSHSDERPNRAVRHRISQWRSDPIVKVIRLRRAKQPSKSNDSDPIDHDFQWMVTGHWRNQWYPSLNRHETIWIAAYTKGPEGKPLKEPRGRVYAVVR